MMEWLGRIFGWTPKDSVLETKLIALEQQLSDETDTVLMQMRRLNRSRDPLALLMSDMRHRKEHHP